MEVKKCQGMQESNNNYLILAFPLLTKNLDSIVGKIKTLLSLVLITRLIISLVINTGVYIIYIHLCSQTNSNYCYLSVNTGLYIYPRAPSLFS